jgi:hypothetical protein
MAVPLAKQLSSDDDEPLERFCPAHSDQIKQDKTFIINHKTGEYKDYIPDYLSSETQVALRLEMQKTVSPADKPGYIYTFQIIDPSTPSLVHLKVGRTSNVSRRINQWGKQCGSREQILRGFWPGTVDQDVDADADGVDLVKGRIRAGAAGPYVARLERLVHLELADLVANSPYLEAGWPKTSTPSLSAVGSPKKGAKLIRTSCSDCK